MRASAADLLGTARSALEGVGRERGHSLVQTLVALSLAGIIAAAAVPSVSGLRERALMRGAARETAALMRSLRGRAIAEGRSIALVFTRDLRGWGYGIYGDGDGDGIRSTDILDGTDPLLSPRARVGDRWPGVEIGFLPLPRVRRVPPATGWLGGLDDPVQFGSTDIVSFTPRGESSSGTIYLADGKAQMAAVVLFGPTTRTRVFRYDAAREEWFP